MHKAKKSLGQNFLKSEIALRKIIEAGEINPVRSRAHAEGASPLDRGAATSNGVKNQDLVLEIGPGKGALTKQLLGSSDQVLAVEKDKELIEFLKQKFNKEIEEKKLILVEGDILEFNTSHYNLETRTYKLIANIPYNITGAILKKFLTEKNQPKTMVLMVQHEVAQRILARDGKESILSISVKAYGEPKMVAKVDKRYFSPAPKVNSAIISIKNISRKIFEENKVNEEKFWEIEKTGFAHKRKKLSGNLKGMCQGESLASFGDKRAENLTLSDWVSLSKS